MSSLLSGPTGITPWIETTMYESLLNGPESLTRRPKIVQVLARGGPGWTAANASGFAATHCQECPSYMVVQDGKTSVVVFLNQQPTPAMLHATRGSIVKISDWKISLSKHIARSHLMHLLQRDDNAATFLTQLPDEESILCFVAENIELLGAQGMGIVGNPTDVHRSIEVRRVLMSIQSRTSLAAALNLPTEVRLGNVRELLERSRDGSSNAVDTLLSLAQTNVGRPRVVNGTVLGNVQELFAARERNPTSAASISSILALAGSIPPPSSVQGGTAQAGANGEEAGASAVPSSGSVTQNGVADGGTVESSAQGSTSGVVLGNVRMLLQSTFAEILALGNRQQGATAVAQAATSTQATATTNEARTQETEATSMPQAAGESSTTGVQELFSAVLQTYRDGWGNAESSTAENSAARVANSNDEAQEEEVAVAQSANKPTPSFQQQQVEEADESDSDSEILGISDMLVSQTQPEDLEDTKPAAVDDKGGASDTEPIPVDALPERASQPKESQPEDDSEDEEVLEETSARKRDADSSQDYPSDEIPWADSSDDEESDDNGPGSLLKSFIQKAKAGPKKITSRKPPPKRRRVVPATGEGVSRLRELIRGSAR